MKRYNKKTKLLFSFLISFKLCLSLIINIWPETAHMASIIPSRIFELNNEERMAEEMDVVGYSKTLEKSAKYKAADMLKNGYFSHDSPAGITPWYWFEQVGYDYLYAGENLAIDYSSNEAVHEAWMNSKTHRDNILNPKFREMGVGVASGKFEGRITTLVATHFGTISTNQGVAGTAKSLFSTSENAAWRVGSTKIEHVVNLIYMIISLVIFGGFIFLLYKKQKLPQEVDHMEIWKTGGMSVVIFLLILI